MRTKIIRAPHLVQGCGLGSIVAINDLDLGVPGIMPLSLEAGALLLSVTENCQGRAGDKVVCAHRGAGRRSILLTQG
jgi:hypothetical protein